MPKSLRSALAVVGGFLLIGALAFGTGKLVQATWPAQVDAAGASERPRRLSGADNGSRKP